MKLQKWLAALLALTLATTYLTACGEQSKPADKDDENQNTAITTTVDKDDEETPAPSDEDAIDPSPEGSTQTTDKVSLADIGFKNWQGYNTWVTIEGYDFDEGYVYTIGSSLSGMKFYEDYAKMVGIDESGNVLEESGDEAMTAMLIVNGNNSAMLTTGDWEQPLVLNRIIDDNEQWIIWKMDDINHCVPLDMIDFSRNTEDIIVPGYEAEYHGTKYYLK